MNQRIRRTIAALLAAAMMFSYGGTALAAEVTTSPAEQPAAAAEMLSVAELESPRAAADDPGQPQPMDTSISALNAELEGEQPMESGETRTLTVTTDATVSGPVDLTVSVDGMGYVRDGLELHWNGARNTRDGFDAAADVWEDLSGQGNDLALTLDAQNYWDEEAGGFRLNCKEFPVPQGLVDLVNADAFTIELVLDDYTLLGSDFGTILSSANDNFSYFHRKSNGVLEFKNASNNRPTAAGAESILQGSTGAVVFEKGATSFLYVDGEAVSTFTPSVNIGANAMKLGHADNTRKFSALIKAIRIYDRALSAEELAHNRMVDEMGAGIQGRVGDIPLDEGKATVTAEFTEGVAELPVVLRGAGDYTLTVTAGEASDSVDLTLTSPYAAIAGLLEGLAVEYTTAMGEDEIEALVAEEAAARLNDEDSGVTFEELSVEADRLEAGVYRLTVELDGLPIRLDVQVAETILYTDEEKTQQAANLLCNQLFPVPEDLTGDQRTDAVLKRGRQILEDSEFAAAGGAVAVEDQGDGRFLLQLTLGEAQEETAVTANVVSWSDSFAQTPAGELPEGWKLAAAEGVTAEVNDGKLLFTAANDDSGSSRLLTPICPDGKVPVRFTYEADIRFVEANSDSRWAGLMFLCQGDTWYQSIARQDATAANGMEFAHWNNGWNVINKGSYSEALAPEKTYHFKAVYEKNTLKQYINDVHMLTTPLMAETDGSFGFSSRGVTLEISNVKVELVPGPKASANFSADLYEPKTGMPLPPTVVQEAGTDTQAIFGAEKRPATVIVYPDEQLRVLDRRGELIEASMDDYLEEACVNTMPAFYLGSDAAAQAVSAYIGENGVLDAFVMADAAHAEWVRTVADENAPVRGIIDFTELPADPTDAQLWEVVTTTNVNHAKIAVIPERAASFETVRYLQSRLITVWVRCSSEASALHAQITSGANGIVTEDYKAAIAAIESYDEITFQRPALITGHRGMPSRYIENTLRSAIGAYEAGADAIENDVYITTNGVIVIDHDGNTGRMYDQALPVEGSTWEQLKALKFKESYHPQEGERMSTLAEFFEAFKGKDVVHFIEIKSSQPKIVGAVRQLAEEYGVVDQCVVITFNYNIMQEMRKTWPEVSCGYLTGLTDTGSAQGNVSQICANVQPVNTTFNPSFSNTAAFAQALKDANQRGVTFWAWTINGYGGMNAAALMGLNGITTNDAYRFADYPEQVIAQDAALPVYDASNPESLYLPQGVTKSYLNQELDGLDYQLVQIGGVPLEKLETEAGVRYYASENGTATAMLKIEQTLPETGETVALYSNPFTLTFTGDEPTDVDKTALKALIETIDGKYEASRYTAASWEALTEALTAAKAVMADAAATQQQVFDAYLALVKARDGLTYAVDTSLLSLAIELAEEALKDESLSSLSKTELQKVVDSAKAVLNNRDATQAEINAAYTAVMTRITELVKADKSLLRRLIATAEGLDKMNYRPSGWAKLETALTEAKAAETNVNATEAMIKAVCDKLVEAINGLVNALNYTGINSAIEFAEKILADSKYDEATKAGLVELVEEAKELREKEDAAQAELDAMAAELTRAAAKVRLAQTVADANARNAANYTAASWNAMLAVKAGAEAVLANPNASEPELTEAAAALTSAVKGLVRKSSGSKGTASNVNSDDYWSGVIEKINSADKGDTIGVKIEEGAMMPATVIDAAAAKGVKLKIEIGGKEYLVSNYKIDAFAVYYSAAELIAMADGEAQAPVASGTANSNPETGGSVELTAAPAVPAASIPAAQEEAGVIEPAKEAARKGGIPLWMIAAIAALAVASIGVGALIAERRTAKQQ